MITVGAKHTNTTNTVLLKESNALNVENSITSRKFPNLRRKTHAVSNDQVGDKLFIGSVKKKTKHLSETEQAFAAIKMGKQGKDIVKLDTGAQVNVIALSVFHQLKDECRQQLQPIMCTLTGYAFSHLP